MIEGSLVLYSDVINQTFIPEEFSWNKFSYNILKNKPTGL